MNIIQIVDATLNPCPSLWDEDFLCYSIYLLRGINSFENFVKYCSANPFSVSQRLGLRKYFREFLAPGSISNSLSFLNLETLFSTGSFNLQHGRVSTLPDSFSSCRYDPISLLLFLLKISEKKLEVWSTLPQFFLYFSTLNQASL